MCPAAELFSILPGSISLGAAENNGGLPAALKEIPFALKCRMPLSQG